MHCLFYLFSQILLKARGLSEFARCLVKYSCVKLCAMINRERHRAFVRIKRNMCGLVAMPFYSI